MVASIKTVKNLGRFFSTLFAIAYFQCFIIDTEVSVDKSRYFICSCVLALNFTLLGLSCPMYVF